VLGDPMKRNAIILCQLYGITKWLRSPKVNVMYSITLISVALFRCTAGRTIGPSLVAVVYLEDTFAPREYS